MWRAMRWPAARSIQVGVALSTLSLAAISAEPARAQAPRTAPVTASEEDLAAARRLFADAVADQDAKRYDTALEKFRHVQTVKDTANVRYRIATCLEALGRRAEALANYQATIRLGEGDRTATDAVRAATEHAAELDRVVPRLTVVLPSDVPPGTQVKVDDATIDAAALGGPIPFEPGAHTITATSPGRTPFQTGVTLPEGGRVSITVILPPAPVSSAPAPASSAPPPPPPPPPDVGSGGPPAGAWIAAGAGVALAAGSVVSFVLRQSNINKLNQDCPTTADGKLQCPQSLSGEVNSARNGAAVEGPLGIGLAAGAAVSAGIAVWLFASPRHGNGVAVAPVVSQGGGMVVLSGHL